MQKLMNDWSSKPASQLADLLIKPVAANCVAFGENVGIGVAQGDPKGRF
jgi:hypothetical protein